MIKKFIKKIKPLIKHKLIEFNLVIPENQKPAKIDYISWERFHILSTLINLSLKSVDSADLKNYLIIEAGVGNGDTFLYLSLIARQLGMQIVGFDSFCGFPEIKHEKDRRNSIKPLAEGQWNVSTQTSIKNKLRNSGLSSNFIDKKVKLIEGFFDHTLKSFNSKKKIFFLHLDVDLYSSYKTCLEYLWDQIVKGGIVVFDEYQDPKWPDAKDAIDEFFDKKGIKVELDNVTKRGFVQKKK